MATFAYPASDLDRPRRLLSLLGSFWSEFYQGNFLVQNYLAGQAQLAAQAHRDLLETVAAVSRYEVPIYHTDQWYFLTLKESEKNGDKVALPRYDGTYQHNGQIQYGVPIPQITYGFPAPADLKDVKLIFNRLTSPSVTLVGGMDYQLDAEHQAIFFEQDPFANPLIPQREIFEGTEIVDREIGLWLFRGQFDWEHAYTHFGYALGVRMASSEGYRDLLNAIFDGIRDGTTLKHVQLALAAITGIPCVVEAEETVELVEQSRDFQLIITDRHVYKFGLEATPIVEEGDVVHAGDQLVDTITIHEFSRGSVPDVPALSLGRGFLLPGEFYGNLIFPNEDVAVEVTTESAKTKISFAIGGFPGDVERFFSLLHARGVAANQTLANLLDTRTNKYGEPGAGALPATINPLEFLCENVLRNNTFLVRLRWPLHGRNPLSLQNMSLLQKLVPPHFAMLILIELDGSEEPVILDSPATSTTPGVSESGDLLLAAVDEGETITPSLITEEGSLRQMSGHCP